MSLVEKRDLYERIRDDLKNKRFAVIDLPKHIDLTEGAYRRKFRLLLFDRFSLVFLNEPKNVISSIYLAVKSRRLCVLIMDYLDTKQTRCPRCHEQKRNAHHQPCEKCGQPFHLICDGKPQVCPVCFCRDCGRSLKETFCDACGDYFHSCEESLCPACYCSSCCQPMRKDCRRCDMGRICAHCPPKDRHPDVCTACPVDRCVDCKMFIDLEDVMLECNACCDTLCDQCALEGVDDSDLCGACHGEEQANRDILETALHEHGLEVCLDSRLCTEFILGERSDVQFIVDRMRWAKLTREYCNWEHFVSMARKRYHDDEENCYRYIGEDAEELISQWLPEEHHDDAPWMSGISKEEWLKIVSNKRRRLV